MSPKSGGAKLAVGRTQSKWAWSLARTPGRAHPAVVHGDRHGTAGGFGEPERPEPAYVGGNLPAAMLEVEQRQRAVNRSRRADDKNCRGLGPAEPPRAPDPRGVERRAGRHEQQRAVIEKQLQRAPLLSDLQRSRGPRQWKVGGDQLGRLADHDQPTEASAAGSTSSRSRRGTRVRGEVIACLFSTHRVLRAAARGRCVQGVRRLRFPMCDRITAPRISSSGGHSPITGQRWLPQGC